MDASLVPTVVTDSNVAQWSLHHAGAWRTGPEWPLARTRPTPSHRHPDGALRSEEPAATAAPATFTHDPANPVPTIVGTCRLRCRDGWDHETLMTPGQIYLIGVALPPTSNLFAARVRICLDISSSIFPRLALNPNTEF